VTTSAKRPILVTGAPRSGTTWVGKMLALAPGVGYVHEPFNPRFSAGCFDRYFTVVTRENEARCASELEHVLTFHYELAPGSGGDIGRRTSRGRFATSRGCNVCGAATRGR
jgi:hypothetical protein